MPTKIIVTHEGAMRKKYGARWTSIKSAVRRLIEADKGRGLTSELIMLDDEELGRWRARKGQPLTFKEAIDRVYGLRRKPDYITILGGPDIVPHQDLVNPLRTKDDDDIVPSDLPYACDAPAGDDPAAFVGPTRVVGRIPDVPKDKDPKLLLALLDLAAGWKAPSSTGKDYFGLSAQVWRRSTTKSLAALFGQGATPHVSPVDGPAWTKNDLGPTWHFINCHGAPVDPHFYGQKKDDYPTAHEAGLLPRKIRRGTVVAAECCYGAELYDASAADSVGICVTYLREGAIGFLGSTTIAYGPADSNASADLLCRFFLESARGGASLGRALLEARQRFVKEVSPINPVDLKTLAQFLLLGDPAAHAILSTGKAANARAKTKQLRAHAMMRGQLEATGAMLARGVDSVASQADATAPQNIHDRMAKEAAKAGYVAVDRTRTFDVRTAQNTAARSFLAPKGAKAFGAKAVPAVRFYVLAATPAPSGKSGKLRAKAMAATGKKRQTPPISGKMIVLGQEVGGKLIKVDRLYAHLAPAAKGDGRLLRRPCRKEAVR